MGCPLWAEGRGGAKPGSVAAGVPCRGQERAAVQALNTHPELWGCRQPGEVAPETKGQQVLHQEGLKWERREVEDADHPWHT